MNYPPNTPLKDMLLAREAIQLKSSPLVAIQWYNGFGQKITVTWIWSN